MFNKGRLAQRMCTEPEMSHHHSETRWSDKIRENWSSGGSSAPCRYCLTDASIKEYVHFDRGRIIDRLSLKLLLHLNLVQWSIRYTYKFWLVHVQITPHELATCSMNSLKFCGKNIGRHSATSYTIVSQRPLSLEIVSKSSPRTLVKCDNREYQW